MLIWAELELLKTATNSGEEYSVEMYTMSLGAVLLMLIATGAMVSGQSMSIL